MNDKAKGMVWGSFIGDALALGAHWIYDPGVIRERFGRIESYITPSKGSYHEGKTAGAFTHYGDQALTLLESLAESGGFDPADFSARWRDLFEDYAGYMDSATRETLKNLAAGKDPLKAGSRSNDLAGASRIAPVVFRYREKEDGLVYAARTQTRMTHDHPRVVEAAEFFARVAIRVQRGESPAGAVEMERRRLGDSLLASWAEMGLRMADTPPVEAIGRFGRSCHVPEAFPAVVYLIARFEGNLKEALVENVMAGGDSAARGMLVGMVLGAQAGLEGIPEGWMTGLKAGGTLRKLLRRIGSSKG